MIEIRIKCGRYPPITVEITDSRPVVCGSPEIKKTRKCRWTKTDDASVALIRLFREKTEWSGDEFWARLKAKKLTRDSILRARDVLDIPKPHRMDWGNGQSEDIWWVPEDWQYLKRDGQPATRTEGTTQS